jgi:beta propeller repeat protein
MIGLLAILLLLSSGTLAEDEGSEAEGDQNQEELPYRLVPGLSSSTGIAISNLAVGGQLVAWEDHRHDDPDVYLYDLSDGRETRIATDDAMRRSSSVSSSAIVWTEGDEPDERVVRMLDLAEDTEHQISGEPGRVDRPDISSQLIAWQEHRDGRWLVQVADRNGDAVATLGEELQNNGRPSADGSQVTWQGHDGESWNIYAFDVESDSVTEVTGTVDNDQYPSLSDGIVVFQRSAESGGSPELIAAPVDGGEERTIVSGHFVQRPSIHGSLVVWEDWRSGLPDIYAFDLDTGEAFAIARSQQAYAPVVSDSVVAWISGNDPESQRVQTMEIQERLPTDPQDPPAVPSPDRLYIPETQHFVSGGFKSFWQANGGPEILGYPLTTEFVEQDPETGEEIVVQYFERVKLEFHPNAPDDNMIRLSLLGYDAVPEEETDPVEPFDNDDESRFFPETGHGVQYGFKVFWRENGGLELFGFPITPEFTENGRIVQYFERARFEFDPESEMGGVSLGLLGREALQDRGWLPPPPLDTTQIFE